MVFGFCLDDVGIRTRIAVKSPNPVVVERVRGQTSNIFTDYVADIQILVTGYVTGKIIARRHVQPVTGRTAYTGPVGSKATGSFVAVVQMPSGQQAAPASAIRAQEFAVAPKNPASRAAREGTRPFHARAQPLSHRDRVIPAHREFVCRVCAQFLSRANSIRASRREKPLHLCTAPFRLRLQGGPTKRV